MLRVSEDSSDLGRQSVLLDQPIGLLSYVTIIYIILSYDTIDMLVHTHDSPSPTLGLRRSEWNRTCTLLENFRHNYFPGSPDVNGRKKQHDDHATDFTLCAGRLEEIPCAVVDRM